MHNKKYKKSGPSKNKISGHKIELRFVCLWGFMYNQKIEPLLGS